MTKKTILVVDDEEDIREFLSLDIKHNGYNVLTASNGAIALSILKNSKIDLVISDIRMPQLDGVGLLKQIRSSFPNPPPVILMTAFYELNRNDALRIGAKDFFSKPIKRMELMSSISKLVSCNGEPDNTN